MARRPFQACGLLTSDDDGCEDKPKKDHAQTDRYPKENALDPAAGGEYATGIGAGKTTQPRSLALQDDAEDQTHRGYN